MNPDLLYEAATEIGNLSGSPTDRLADQIDSLLLKGGVRSGIVRDAMTCELLKLFQTQSQKEPNHVG